MLRQRYMQHLWHTMVDIWNIVLTTLLHQARESKHCYFEVPYVNKKIKRMKWRQKIVLLCPLFPSLLHLDRYIRVRPAPKIPNILRKTRATINLWNLQGQTYLSYFIQRKRNSVKLVRYSYSFFILFHHSKWWWLSSVPTMTFMLMGMF